MKVYIAGKITDNPRYKQQFDAADLRLYAMGHQVMNPTCLPRGFDYEDYMHICYAMIDVCDAVYFLAGWEHSRGANLEHIYARNKGKKMMYEAGLQRAHQGVARCP